METEFTPLMSLFGGALIGLSAVLLMLLNGRIAGISGIVGRLLPPTTDRGFLSQGLAFVVGLIIAIPVISMVAGLGVEQTVSSNLPLLAMAGLLVGFGATLGSGCTSGHGVCGLSRLSTRSLVATGVFMAVAAVTVFVTRHLFV